MDARIDFLETIEPGPWTVKKVCFHRWSGRGSFSLDKPYLAS